LEAEIYAKLEGANPAGSAKDRVAKRMLLDAEAEGKIAPGGTVIEPTSGNTGIGLASLCAAKGYKAIFTMPDTMTKERQMLLRAYGAEIVLTEGRLGMAGAIEKANEIAKHTPNSFLAGQFENPSNPKAHYLTTGPEIWEDTDGKIDALIATIGTGGTITGTGTFLKEKNPNLPIIGVEPKKSPVLSGGKAGAHGIQGIGAGFVPKVLNTEILSEIFLATEEEAFALCKKVAKTDGILVGISSGAALSVAIDYAKKAENQNKKIVVILPDSGERYLSASLFE
jgi:cysteine synthase A